MRRRIYRDRGRERAKNANAIARHSSLAAWYKQKNEKSRHTSDSSIHCCVSGQLNGRWFMLVIPRIRDYTPAFTRVSLRFEEAPRGFFFSFTYSHTAKMSWLFFFFLSNFNDRRAALDSYVIHARDYIKCAVGRAHTRQIRLPDIDEENNNIFPRRGSASGFASN